MLERELTRRPGELVGLQNEISVLQRQLVAFEEEAPRTAENVAKLTHFRSSVARQIGQFDTVADATIIQFLQQIKAEHDQFQQANTGLLEVRAKLSG